MPIVVPDLLTTSSSSSSYGSTSPTSLPQESTGSTLTEKLVDEKVSEFRDSHASSSHEPATRAKTKTSQETQRSLQKFLEPERKPKVI